MRCEGKTYGEEHRKILGLWKQEKNVKQKNRYHVVLLYLEGYPRREIAGVLHTAYRTVCDHIARYQEDGIEGLRIKKQPGAEKKLTEEQEQEFLRIISTQTPEEAGIGIFANWTSPLACQLVKERYGITYSERGMRNLFERLGLSYTRPTYTLNKADPQKQEEFRQTFEGIKKNSLMVK